MESKAKNLFCKLVVNNIYTKVITDNPEVENLISEALSVKGKNYWFSTLYKQHLWDGKTRFYNRLTKKFPTGLLPKLINILTSKGIIYQIENLRKGKTGQLLQLNPKSLAGIEARDYQIQAARICLQKDRGIVHMATNAGKTEIAALIIKSLGNPKTLFLVHRKDLLYQTKERFEKRLQIPIRMIYADVDENSDSPILVATVQTLYKRIKTKKVQELLANANLLFLDECHILSSYSWNKVALRCDSYYRFALSGTPLTGDDVKDAKLVGATGEILFKVSNQELIEQGYSAVPIINIIVLDEVEKYLDKVGLKYPDIYKEGIVYNEMRNRAIVNLINRKESFVIMVRLIQHGTILKELIKKEGFDVKFISGNDEIEKRLKVTKDFKENKLKVLITSTILDEGIDIPNIRNLIVAGGGKSHVKTLQRIGRGLRKKKGENILNFYDFVDKSSKYLLRHSLKRLEDYEKEGFLIKRLEM